MGKQSVLYLTFLQTTLLVGIIFCQVRNLLEGHLKQLNYNLFEDLGHFFFDSTCFLKLEQHIIIVILHLAPLHLVFYCCFVTLLLPIITPQPFQFSLSRNHVIPQACVLENSCPSPPVSLWASSYPYSMSKGPYTHSSPQSTYRLYYFRFFQFFL